MKCDKKDRDGLKILRIQKTFLQQDHFYCEKLSVIRNHKHFVLLEVEKIKKSNTLRDTEF